MNVLAFDTSLGDVSVAVSWQAGAVREMREVREAAGASRAERLMPLIDQVMRANALAFDQLDRIAVTTGPGNFTGVRLGIAAARGLGLATGAGIVGMTTLQLLAHQASAASIGSGSEGELIIAMEAGRGMIYAQTFRPTGEPVREPWFLLPEELAARLAAGPFNVVGSAAPVVAAAIRATGATAEASVTDLAPSAGALALLAPTLAVAGQVRPLYLRPADAKPQVDASLPRAARE
jgi:tRNA threonylcarbamoyladenosine biosynthesis protein TsaB